MDIQEIEDNYKRDVEYAEKIFLNGLKNKLPIKNIEKKYYSRVLKSRERYTKEIRKIINNKTIKKNKNKFKQIWFKRFKVKHKDFSTPLRTKMYIQVEIFFFKLKILIKDIFNKIYYPTIAYYSKLIKYNLNKRLVNTINFIEENSKKIIDKTKKNAEELNKKISEINSKLKEMMIKLISKKSKKEDKPLTNDSTTKEEVKEEIKT